MEDKELKDFLPNKKASYIKKFGNSNNVTKIKEEQVAAERIQNIARGNLARKRVRNIRKERSLQGLRAIVA